MKRALNWAMFALLLFTVFSTMANAHAAEEAIASRTAEVGGVKLHYLAAGHGAPLILLHGYAETSLMWKPIIPLLAARFTVIAPDLPGIGDSGIPTDGLDMKSAAVRIHGLAKSLGVQKAEVVVNGPTPEALVQGRERTYFDYFWNDFAADKNHSVPEADRKAYVAAYSRPGRMHAGWAYFVSFQQAAKDFAELSQTKLTMPLLTIGGEKSLGGPLGEQTKLVATNVTVVVIKNAGHWVLEEQPKETTAALQNFL
jgi:pimeloyl-ACP methyl ester carboxylesterase